MCSRADRSLFSIDAAVIAASVSRTGVPLSDMALSPFAAGQPPPWRPGSAVAPYPAGKSPARRHRPSQSPPTAHRAHHPLGGIAPAVVVTCPGQLREKRPDGTATTGPGAEATGPV